MYIKEVVNMFYILYCIFNIIMKMIYSITCVLQFNIINIPGGTSVSYEMQYVRNKENG